MRRLLVVSIGIAVCLTPAWAELDAEFVQKLLSGNPESGEQIGYEIAVDGDIAVLGTAGGAYVFARRDGVWEQDAVLGDGECRAHSVAVDEKTVVIHCETWCISTPFEPGCWGLTTFRVYFHDGSSWVEQGRISTEPATNGGPVAISGDVILIGQTNFSGGFGSRDHAYFYERTNGGWTLQQRVPSGAISHVALDGDVAVLGEWEFVRVFRRVDGAWAVEAQFFPDEEWVWAGAPVAVDGNTVAVGDGCGYHGGPGAVYVYSTDGDGWSREAKLRDEASSGGCFGVGVAIAGDRLVVGGGEDGSVRVFKRRDGTWTERIELFPPDGPAGGPGFGVAVATSGTTTLIGRPHDPTVPEWAGSVYVYTIGCAMDVTLDIKPDSLDNPINPDSRGTTPVAILGSADLDVTTIDPATLRFGPRGAPLAHKHGHLQDINMDGHMDLVQHYDTQKAGLSCDDEIATVTGETFDECEIEGADRVTPVGRCLWTKAADDSPVVPVFTSGVRSKHRPAK